MCFQRSPEGIEGKSRPPQSGWKIVPQSRTGCRETPVAKFVVYSWHEQLPGVIGMRPQRTTTSVRQKMTVISKIKPWHNKLLARERDPTPDGRRRGSTSSAFGLVTVFGCAPYATVDVRRPSFPGCRLASLEQSATRHVCTVTACFLQSSEDSSLQSQFSLTILSCLRSDTRHYGHINRCSYLLTYLLTLNASCDSARSMHIQLFGHILLLCWKRLNRSDDYNYMSSFQINSVAKEWVLRSVCSSQRSRAPPTTLQWWVLTRICS